MYFKQCFSVCVCLHTVSDFCTWQDLSSSCHFHAVACSSAADRVGNTGFSLRNQGHQLYWESKSGENIFSTNTFDLIFLFVVHCQTCSCFSSHSFLLGCSQFSWLRTESDAFSRPCNPVLKVSHGGEVLSVALHKPKELSRGLSSRSALMHLF